MTRLLVIAFASVSAAAAGADAERPVVHPVHVDTPPLIDGDVVGDEVWRSARPAIEFWQTAPDEGDPATERTEVFVVYSDDTLYFGVVCHDRDPGGIIVAGSRRDSSLEDGDSFQLILDTYRDRQTGFVFGTNPVGVEYDGQVTREGEGSFRSAGGFNRNWDGSWEVRARISDIGWSAELAIPFRTLRFPKGRLQSWGVNFQRNIRRRNETAYWASLPRQYNLYRLSFAGTLNELQVPRQQNLKVVPYYLAAVREEGVEGSVTEDRQEVGIDLKYSMTPSLTLDGTLNTDFAQVEADELQINLDRFNLFFPEKRPFFLENAGFFSVGVPEEVELFYSRRIGLGDEGEVIPIEGGIRLSGKSGRFNLGLLHMQTDELAGVEPENQLSVIRVGRDLASRSSLGGLFIRRRGRGSLAGEDDENRTFAVDGRWGIGQSGLIEGFVGRTETPGLEGRDHALRLGGGFDSKAWSLSVNYTEVAENFNPEVGFLTRSGYRKSDIFLLRTIRPESFWGLQELRPHLSYRGFWDFDGFQETGHLHVDNHWEWRNGNEVHTGVNLTREGVSEAFEIFEGVVVPAGTYDHTEIQLIGFTNQGAPVSFSFRIVAGGFFGGDRVAVTPALRFRSGEALTAEIDWRNNDIDLPGGSFETNLGRLRVSYSFSPRIFVQGLIQYNDGDDIWASNLRFGWLHTANTGLYLVYNEIRDIGDAGTGIPDRSVTLKYSRLFDLMR